MNAYTSRLLGFSRGFWLSYQWCICRELQSDSTQTLLLANSPFFSPGVSVWNNLETDHNVEHFHVEMLKTKALETIICEYCI